MVSAAWLSQQRTALEALVLLSVHEAGTAITASSETPSAPAAPVASVSSKAWPSTTATKQVQFVVVNDQWEPTSSDKPGIDYL